MLSHLIQPNTLEHAQILDSLGLSADFLSVVGDRILAAYNQTTPNDAAGASGQYAYLAAVRALRDVLGPHGWEPFKRQNLEMVISPTKQMAIITSSGDGLTGLDGDEPRTKNPKGNQTKDFIVKNRNQDFLFPELEPAEPNFNQDSIPTWVLLYHYDRILSEMRMELSLPIHIDISDLRVDQWFTRVRFPAIKFDKTPAPQPYGSAQNFEIEIKRKISK